MSETLDNRVYVSWAGDEEKPDREVLRACNRCYGNAVSARELERIDIVSRYGTAHASADAENAGHTVCGIDAREPELVDGRTARRRHRARHQCRAHVRGVLQRRLPVAGHSLLEERAYLLRSPRGRVGNQPVPAQGLFAAHNPYQLKDYLPHTPPGVWQTMSVYLAENMADESWGLLP